MNEVRIQLGATRSAVAEDHLWRAVASAAPGVPGAFRAPAASEPALLDTLPTAERYLVIVPPERLRLFRVALPAGPRKSAWAALPFLLEERLIEPLEHYEIVPLDDGVDGRGVWVAVFERDWLAGARAALKRISRGEVRWVLAGWGWTVTAQPEGAALAPAWQLRIEADRCLLRRDGPEVAVLSLANLEAALTLALHGDTGGKPQTVFVDPGADAASLERLEAWGAVQGVAVQRAELPDAWVADYAACPWSLFRQNRSRLREAVGRLKSLAAWRPLLWVGGGLALTELLLGLAYWGMLSAGTAAAQREAAEIFRAVAGPTAVVVDPSLQLRRLFQTRRHQDGKTTADDFVPLLAAVSANLPSGVGQLSEIGYEGQKLRLVMPAAAQPAPASGLAGHLRAAGWQVIANLSPDQRQLTLLVSR